jgi:hypothetical protein
MGFNLFSHLDPAIIDDESSTVRASRSPAVWPSEASAIRVDRAFYNIYGTCMRRAFYRMIGWPKTEEISADSPWKWIVGRAIEDKLTDLCTIAQFKQPNGDLESLYVANGVKHYLKDLYLSIEMDVVVRDPQTSRGWIIECKSYDGYFAEKEIEKEGKPKVENLIQVCIYLFGVKTGKRLKEIIHQSLDERIKLDANNEARRAAGEKVIPHRNRCEANVEVLEKMSDGPLGAKLVYISRGECNRNEFDIEIFKDNDGFHYPMVNGMPYRLFTIESVYDRFQTLQNYWFRARNAGVEILEERGLFPPDTLNLILTRGDVPDDMTVRRPLSKAEWAAEAKYLEQLENTVRSLPEEYFPLAEYEWAYPTDRIKELGDAKILSKTKYDEWKKGKVQRLGDWQCAYCPFAASGCVAKQRPDMAYQLYDISNLPEDMEVQIG